MLKKLLQCDCASKHTDKAYSFLRIVLGLIIFFHGWMKYTDMGISGVAGFFGQVGIPFATFFAYFVTVGELVAGLLLVLGMYTHWAAKFVIVTMLGAIYFVHWENGFLGQGGFEFPLALLAMAIFVLARGNGTNCTAMKFFKR